MKHIIGFLLLFILILPGLAVASPASQEDNNSGNKKSEDKKPDKPATTPTVTLHVKVSTESAVLPKGSTIELKGDDKNCDTLSRPGQSLEPDGAVTFPNLPECKVRLLIFITGYEFKVAPVDLGHYKDPIQISVRKVGPPIVSSVEATASLDSH